MGDMYNTQGQVEECIQGLSEKLEGKASVGSLRHRKDLLDLEVIRCGGVNWIHLAQDSILMWIFLMG
jgi:hypothetical protein